MVTTETAASEQQQHQPKKRGPKPTKFRKAPQAPKRFKSAFMFFSVAKHPEFRAKQKLNKDADHAVPNVAKLVSEAWRGLSPDERAVWDKLAADDKKRYEVERAMYTGPWKVPAPKRARKSPDAPKRPMSAFLAYSKKMRSSAKAANQHLSNTEVSKLLADMWKQESEDVKEEFIKKEAEQRALYKTAIAEWRTEQQEKLENERKIREDMVRNVIANGGAIGVGAAPPGYNPPLPGGYAYPPNTSSSEASHAPPTVPPQYHESYGYPPQDNPVAQYDYAQQHHHQQQPQYAQPNQHQPYPSQEQSYYNDPNVAMAWKNPPPAGSTNPYQDMHPPQYYHDRPPPQNASYYPPEGGTSQGPPTSYYVGEGGIPPPAHGMHQQQAMHPPEYAKTEEGTWPQYSAQDGRGAGNEVAGSHQAPPGQDYYGNGYYAA
eukprot:CAMPEP_0172500514 /NCGR_PEP_ID=MMETSP1066-20121228/139453_1 /TAXON_ID=671091 /ORGANISM="Coscinodiscus wailesii, Strain CCMP2513" /LENGTH=430 /DNA_ID=CAMNT_0013274793 /DNA_START=55 /DNA_END=1347 /DNA_ORIENTATION=+